MNSMSLFDWIMLAMGAYVLYAGITGKGRLYVVENVKEGMEENLKKFSRLLYIILGIIMVVNSATSIVKYAFYAYQEVLPATDTAAAVYDWVAIKDLGSFSFLTVQVLDIIAYVFLGLCIACIVILIIGFRKMTDKNAKPKPKPEAQQAAQNQAGHVLPVSAFEFEEEAQPESEEPKQ